LLTYKLSQDHLEHFFGLIRARFGANNNPTPLQFKNTYRRLLLGITNNIVHNVLIQDNSEIVALVPSVQDKINYICDIYNFDDVTVDDIVLKITETSEKIIEIELKEKNWLTKKYYVDYLILKIITNFVSVHGNCFKTMDNHAYELTKQVISCYTCIRVNIMQNY